MREKIRKRLRWWRVKIEKWFLRHTKKLNTRGLYVCYYIIDKYILRTKPDDQNYAYEKYIDITLERMRTARIFEQLGVNVNRTDAAYFTLGNFMLIAPKEMREKIYDYLGDWAYKDKLKEYIESGVFI